MQPVHVHGPLRQHDMFELISHTRAYSTGPYTRLMALNVNQYFASDTVNSISIPCIQVSLFMPTVA